MEFCKKKEAQCTPFEKLSEEVGDHWVWLSFDPGHKVILAFVTGRINQENADELLEKTQQVTDGSLRVFFSDQRPEYPKAILKAWGHWVQPERKGSRGRFPKPRLEAPEALVYAQVVKHRRKGRVVEVTPKVVFGTPEALQTYLSTSKVSSAINTAFVERENGTMRQHNRRFSRKTLAFSKRASRVDRQMSLWVGYYHFCLPHSGLREELPQPIPTKGDGSPKKWKSVTPAISIGITDHVWSLKEMLTFRIPPKTTNNSSVKGH